MSKHFAIGLAALLCLALVGCGGGGDGVSQSTVDQLQTELDAAQAELEKQAEQDEAEDAADEKREQQIADLAAAIAALTASLAEQETATTTETTTTEPDEEEEEEEEEDTTAATTPTTTPTTPTTPTTQSAQASQLAEHLMEAFGTVPSALTLNPSPVTSEVRTQGSQRLVRDGYTTVAVSTGTGIGSATMTPTSGKTGKTHVRTDRKTTRALLEQYDDLRNATDDTRFNLTDELVITGGVIPHVTTPQVSTMWRISHGVPASVGAVDGDTSDDDPNDPTTTMRDDLPDDAEEAETPRASYTGYLHGLSGTFVCGGVPGCQVQVTPEYGTDGNTADITNGRFTLKSVSVAAVLPSGATGTPVLYFKPSSGATLQLYEGGPVGVDDEYMIYGYWYREPSTPAGEYAFDWFAQAFGGAATWPSGVTGTVYYNGTAVGMYVEKDPNVAVDTYRHGEFVADVVLAATSATDVTGTVDDFTTMPIGSSSAPVTSDRWVVELNASNEVNLKGMTGTTAGAWNHAFVPAHENAADDKPLPAVVGGFDARIENSLSLVGAFGAESE